MCMKIIYYREWEHYLTLTSLSINDPNHTSPYQPATPPPPPPAFVNLFLIWAESGARLQLSFNIQSCIKIV